LAPALIGENPCELGKLQGTMDGALKGHPYAKSPLDMACWDILGKAAGMPCCDLMGGRFGEDFPLYRAISQLPPQEMADNVAMYREQGYRRFQLKVGGAADVDIDRIFAVAEILKIGDKLVADANTGWLKHDAIRVVRAVGEVDTYIEQPCVSYEDCLSIRRRTDHPFVLDESIDCIAALLRANTDQAMDAVNIKISKFRRTHGGPARPRLGRIARFGADRRRHLGRRYRHRGDRASCTQYSARQLVHCDRFQQLRYRCVCRRRPAAHGRSVGGSHRSGPGSHARRETSRGRGH
jgi:L-alanine-DL-glutamate epimerase-like enolase superfamily enzyme